MMRVSLSHELNAAESWDRDDLSATVSRHP